MRRSTAFALGAVLGGVLSASIVWSRRAVRVAEEGHPATGHLLQLADGGVLHVVEAGDGPPVVLIHGSPGTLHGMVATVFDDLAESHRVIAVDRPGHGWSVPPPGARHDVELSVRMIRAGLEHLGVRRPVVVGHSYGAATALRWAVDHPGEMAGLVLLAPAAFPVWREPLWLMGAARLPVVGRYLTDALVVPLGRLSAPAFEPRAFGPARPPEVFKRYSRALFLRPASFRAMAEEYETLAEQLAPVSKRYGTIDVPTVIVAADEDLVTPNDRHAEPLATAVPGAELVVLPRTGHELFWAHPEAVVAAVERVEERAAAR